MYKIDRHECIECGLCEAICPRQAISQHDDFSYEIDDKCVSCGLCAKKCPVNAISKVD